VEMDQYVVPSCAGPRRRPAFAGPPLAGNWRVSLLCDAISCAAAARKGRAQGAGGDTKEPVGQDGCSPATLLMAAMAPRTTSRMRT
jgi:hypothetical protein